GAAVEAGPKGGFAHGLAAGGDHFDVVVGDAADHVGVGFEVTHGSETSKFQHPTSREAPRTKLQAPGKLQARRSKSVRQVFGLQMGIETGTRGGAPGWYEAGLWPAGRPQNETQAK